MTDQKPGASLALVAVKAAGGELRIELPLDDAPAQQGEALAVLHAMWCALPLMIQSASAHSGYSVKWLNSRDGIHPGQYHALSRRLH